MKGLARPSALIGIQLMGAAYDKGAKRPLFFCFIGGH
jgi:hypothetical protein